MINEEVKKMALSRLNKIEGQIKGISSMIQGEKYCIDIINQINAVRRALEQVALIVMKRHVESCVADSIRAGSNNRKIDELIETVNKFIK